MTRNLHGFPSRQMIIRLTSELEQVFAQITDFWGVIDPFGFVENFQIIKKKM